MPTPASISIPPKTMNNVMLSARNKFPHRILKSGIKYVVIIACWDPILAINR
jgi:hypothetical protein